MEYITVEQAIDTPGLRLVLTAGVPGPWGEAAKSIFYVKNLPFVAVSQEGGGENAALQAWTGQNSAPVAILDNEPPCTHSLDILYLAERLNPSPSLIPETISQRVQMFGLIQLIIGEQGFAWQRRLMMLQPIMKVKGLEEIARRLGTKYGYSEEAASRSSVSCGEIIAFLVEHLKSQQQQGSSYFIGDKLTAVDIYWANFAGMLRPLPPEVNPMPDSLRQTYSHVPAEIEAAMDDILFQHRDFIYAQHLSLPLNY